MKSSTGSSRSSKDIQTIVAFETFDIDTREWKSMRCVGDDPWEIMEYTALPLYHGEHEPSSVIIWGGYRQLDAKALKDPVVIEEFKAEYGNEVLSMGLPYRRRLLRFDIQTNTWILLEPLCDVDVTPTRNVSPICRDAHFANVSHVDLSRHYRHRSTKLCCRIVYQ